MEPRVFEREDLKDIPPEELERRLSAYVDKHGKGIVDIPFKQMWEKFRKAPDEEKPLIQSVMLAQWMLMDLHIRLAHSQLVDVGQFFEQLTPAEQDEFKDLSIPDVRLIIRGAQWAAERFLPVITAREEQITALIANASQEKERASLQGIIDHNLKPDGTPNWSKAAAEYGHDWHTTKKRAEKLRLNFRRPIRKTFRRVTQSKRLRS